MCTYAAARIVHHQGRCGFAIIHGRYAVVALLSGCVPDLKLDHVGPDCQALGHEGRCTDALSCQRWWMLAERAAGQNTRHHDDDDDDDDEPPIVFSRLSKNLFCTNRVACATGVERRTDEPPSEGTNH